MSAVIPSGKHTVITASPKMTFRPERVVISPNSFPLSRWRAIWTWPLVVIGAGLGRAHRAIARLMRVDLYAPRERREYVDNEPDSESVERVDFEADHFYDADEGRYYQVTPIPLNRRERFLAPIGRAADRLAGVRVRWQLSQLAFVFIRNVTISARALLADSLPSDMFASSAIGSFVNFGETCAAGHDIAIEIGNDSLRECRLVMALIGTTMSDRAEPTSC